MMTTSSQLHPIKGLKAELNYVAGRPNMTETKVVTVSRHKLADTKKWGLQMGVTNTGVHQFTDDKSCNRQNVAPRVNKDSTPNMF
jgi:hypothetical protein